MYLLVCSITSIESLAGFRVLFDSVGARGVFSSINETFSLTLSSFSPRPVQESPSSEQSNRARTGKSVKEGL